MVAAVYLRHDRQLKIVSCGAVRGDPLDSPQHPLHRGMCVVDARSALGAPFLAEQPMAVRQVINVAARQNDRVAGAVGNDGKRAVVKWRLQQTSVQLVITRWRWRDRLKYGLFQDVLPVKRCTERLVQRRDVTLTEMF